MKKKILLLIPALIILTGCSKNSSPSFEKYSNDVTYEVFKDGITSHKFSEYLDFSKSCKGKVYYGLEQKLSATIGDVAIYTDEGSNEREITFGYDATNNRSSIKEKGESSYICTGAEVDEQRVSKTTMSSQYQFNDKLNSFIFIDLKEKTYKKYSSENVTDNILFAIDDEYVGFQSLYKQYESIEGEMKSRYGFYIDGETFTMTYRYTEEKETFSGENSELASRSNNSYDFLFQFKIESGKFQFKSKRFTVLQDTYLLTSFGHLKDEIDVDTTTNSCFLEIGPDSSVIKEIDISSYASLDKEKDGGLLS